jgi:hypothetical protein
MKPAASLVILAIAAALAACAAQPPGSVPASASRFDASARLNLKVSHPVSSRDVVSIARPQVLHLPYGYYKIMVNGRERYCHKETYTGSRVQTEEVCYSKAQLESIEEHTREYMQNVQSYGETCVYNSPGAAGGMGSCK